MNPGLLQQYLTTHSGSSVDSGVAAYYASLDLIHRSSPEVAKAIVRELRDQRRNLKLIASENYCSLATQLAHGNLLTDKYAEGFIRFKDDSDTEFESNRYYAGCDNVDTIEAEAMRLARALFGAEHAYVQPHSGADANLVAFLAILITRVQNPFLMGKGFVNKEGKPDFRSLTDP